MDNKENFSDLNDLDKIAIMFFQDEKTYREMFKRSGPETVLNVMELDALGRIDSLIAEN